MIKTNYIHNGDAISYLKSLPNECVDMIVTDPPYKVTSRGGSGSMGGYWTSDIAHSGKIFEHNDITANDFFADLYRVLKDKSIAYVMCNNVNLIEYLNEGVSVGFNFVKSLIWDKGNKICGRYYMNCFEYVLLFRKGGDRPVNDCGVPDILKIPIIKDKNADGSNIHDTQKPTALFKLLIEQSSNEGDLVLDPFMGSGTTALACLQSNREYIGCEIDDKYYNVIMERIKKEKKKLKTTLF